MASQPSFAATPIVGAGVAPATNDTSLTAPTNVTVIVSATRTIASLTTINASAAVVAGDGSFTSNDEGKSIVATGIPSNTVISAVTDSEHATLSQAATASATVSATVGTAGLRINELALLGLGTTANGRLNIFLKDESSAYHLRDQFLITAVTPSATLEVFNTVRAYSNLFVPAGWSLVVSVMETGNESLVEVVASGGSF